MNPQEEFDDIFKRKTEEAKFSFRQSDWENARKMIDKERMAAFNASSGTNYWLVSALVLATSISLFYISLPESSPLAQTDEVVFQPDEIISQSQQKGSTAKINSLLNASLTEKTGAIAKTINTEQAQPSAQEPTGQTKGGNLISEQTGGLESAPIGNTIEEKQEESFTHTNHELTGQINDIEFQASGLNLQSRAVRWNSTSVEKEIRSKTVFLKKYEEDYVKKPRPKFVRSYLDANLGLMYASGWQNNGNITANGLNGYVGVRYGHFLSKKFSFSIGAELYNLSHMNQEFYSASSKEYGFGSSLTQTVLSCQSMLFLSFPLNVFYSIDNNHQIGLGVNAGNLLSSSNTYETSKVLDGSKQNISTMSTKGVYEGMNTRNLVVNISFHKSIGDRIGLQFEMFYGISDLFTDTQTNKEHQNTNGLRVGMNYRLFRN